MADTNMIPTIKTTHYTNTTRGNLHQLHIQLISAKGADIESFEEDLKLWIYSRRVLKSTEAGAFIEI
jgi:hypothetical protein